MNKRKILTFILTGILMLSCMSLVVPRVQAAPQHPIVLPFSTGWEDLHPAHGRRDSVDYSKDFSSPECGRVLNEVGPPDVYGYDLGSYHLKAAGRFDSSNSYCYFNLFDMTPDSDWGPPIKIRPYTFINIWYYHADLAHSMIDAQLYNSETHQYETLRDFHLVKHINGYVIYKYVEDQNGVRIHPGYRYNDTVGSWQFASFDLSIVYEDSPNWYVTKIWIGFDNRIDPDHPTAQARTYFDMLYIRYGAGNRQITTFNDEGAYYNAWTTGSIITRRYIPDSETGTYDLELKVAISAFNDGYKKDVYGGPKDPIRPYMLRVSTTAGEAEFLDFPQPTGLNLTQPDLETDEVAEFVLDALVIIVSLKCADIGLILEASKLAIEFCGLLKPHDPDVTTYEWPDAVGWFTHGLPYYDLPTLIQGEVCIKISGLSPSVTHSIPITFEVDYCYPYYDPMWGLYPLHFWTESFTLNIEWSTTPDYVNLPPETPSTPSGPISGYVGTSYSYSTSTTDPNGDDVRYEFDWGDDSTKTTGWYASGSNASASHTWGSSGIYDVKVRAKDFYDLWSDWSPSLEVSIYPSLTVRTCTAEDAEITDVKVWIDGALYYSPATVGLGTYAVEVESSFYRGQQPVRIKYTFDHWEGDGIDGVTSNPVTVTVTETTIITAYYEVEDIGCPTLLVWNGSEYVYEALLDIHAESDITLQHQIEQPLVKDGAFYKLSLRELDEFTSHIDQVKLYAVDTDGKIHTCYLIRACHSELGRVTTKLLFDDERRVDLQPTQSIDLKFLYLGGDIAHFIFEINGHNTKIQ